MCACTGTRGGGEGGSLKLTGVRGWEGAKECKAALLPEI